jgi:hypothetical protein
MCGHRKDEHEGGDGECEIDGCGCSAYEEVEPDAAGWPDE